MPLPSGQPTSCCHIETMLDFPEVYFLTFSLSLPDFLTDAAAVRTTRCERLLPAGPAALLQPAAAASAPPPAGSVPAVPVPAEVPAAAGELSDALLVHILCSLGKNVVLRNCKTVIQSKVFACGWVFGIEGWEECLIASYVTG